MIKKLLKTFIVVIVVGLVMIQFVRIDKTNPPVVQAETLGAAMDVPADIAMILGRSCNDCHSHQTIYPWYSNIQPSGWFLEDHILEARTKLNFSIFNTYSPKKKEHKLEEVCEEVQKAAMPLPSYLWLHGEAVLSSSDAKALCDWTKVERAKIVIEPTP
jgi:hypothetical protein